MSKSKSTKQVAAAVAIANESAPVVVAPVAVPKVAPLAVAKEINFARGQIAADQEPTAAGVVKTAKGTNPSKARVYGYDNGVLGGGTVPKQALIAVVPNAKPPAGVTSEQWLLLQQFHGKSVTVAYDNQVASRSVRRAYRAGAIRFVNVQ